MPAFTAAAPAKIILFGEHAVVYGEPAIAVPVNSLQARVVVSPDLKGSSGQIWIEAPELSLSSWLDDLSSDHPLRAALIEAAGEGLLADVPACRILINSTIPVSAGLGSSAAVAAAVIRAFSGFLGLRLSDAQVSEKTFAVEKIQHGTPSGIDNSVVVFNQPVYYQQGSPIERLSIGKPFQILIADSGEPGQTLEAVSAVRQAWLTSQEQVSPIFSQIGQISRKAREHITAGRPQELGALMNRNQALLQELGVSTPTLDQLAKAALEAGALGAKLSGGGLGGNLLVLPGDQAEAIRNALLAGGAKQVLQTAVGGEASSSAPGQST